jgi:hypothetical protein
MADLATLLAPPLLIVMNFSELFGWLFQEFRKVCTYMLGVDQIPLGCFYPHLKSTHILFFGMQSLLSFLL